MKKIIIMFLCFMLLVGCSCSVATSTPTSKVKTFLNKYKTLDNDVKDDLSESVEKEILNTENKDKYKLILEKQYKSLEYRIINEEIDKDNAIVNVEITVYDLYKSIKESDAYLEDNPETFQTNKEFDKDKYDTYKLNQMESVLDKKKYEINIYLTRVDGEWMVQEPESIVKEKLHGFYNYED